MNAYGRFWGKVLCWIKWGNVLENNNTVPESLSQCALKLFWRLQWLITLLIHKCCFPLLSPSCISSSCVCLCDLCPPYSPDWSQSAAEHHGSPFLPFAVPTVSSQPSALRASPPAPQSHSSTSPPLQPSLQAPSGPSAGRPQPLWPEPGAPEPPAPSPSGCLELLSWQTSQLPDAPPGPDTLSPYVQAFQTGSVRRREDNMRQMSTGCPEVWKLWGWKIIVNHCFLTFLEGARSHEKGLIFEGLIRNCLSH